MITRSVVRREAITIGIALAVSVVAGSLLIVLTGKSPTEVFSLLISGTWGNAYGFGQVLFRATPIILTGLAVALAFKVGLFNIGAEGQMIVGSFATALCGTSLPDGTPAVIAIPLCIAVGMVGGGLLGSIPGLLRAYYGAHEVINTIMLNFIAAALVLWLGNEFFFARATTRTEPIIEGARLSNFDMFPGSNANTSIVLAILLAVAVHLFLTRTRRGYEWRAVGHNPRAAENGGVNVRATIIGAMTASGALAGAVGANFVLGYKHYFENDMGTGVGFMGIAVALLGRNHPAGIIAAALLFGTLSAGGLTLAVSVGVPKDFISVLQAVIILAVAAAAATMYLRQHKKGDQAGDPQKGKPGQQNQPGKGDNADG
ncbi:MAG: ABC transporter permease [Proteobacteria bacterium]|nr:ABC transporter permease [Pseudomonadota bacterium]